MTVISIIIPTYRDNERLAKCLEAIRGQVAPSSPVEVIIANNDPESSIPSFEDFPIGLKVTSESAAGSYAARNKGVSVAEGSYYLFTDSDCIPSSNWIETALQVIKSTPLDILAGKVEVFSERGNAYGKFDKAFAFPNEDYVNKEGFGVTANLLVRKEVMDTAGGFARGFLTGGDREFCNRAQMHGFTVHYAADLTVYHPARESFQEMSKKAKRFGGRLPQDKNKGLVFLKLVGKFRLRIEDLAAVQRSPYSWTEKIQFIWIIARLRWVEAFESMRVFFGKTPRRL